LWKTISNKSQAKKTDSSREDIKEKYSGLRLKPGVKFFETLTKLSRPISKYELRIPFTYVLGESKMLIYDKTKGYLTKVEVISKILFQHKVALEAIEIVGKFQENRAALESPAYIFCQNASTRNFDVNAELVNWRKLIRKLEDFPNIDTYIQKYIQLNKTNKHLYRLIYYCNPEKSRRSSYVQLINLKKFQSQDCFEYAGNSCKVLYKRHIGIKELELVGKKITILANIEYRYRLKKIRLDFIKDNDVEPKFWLIGLHSYEIDPDSLLENPIKVLFSNKDNFI